MSTRDHILGWHERMRPLGSALRSLPTQHIDTSREDFERGDQPPEAESPEADLPEGVWEGAPGVYMAQCRSCERDYELCFDPQEFHKDTNYCGGSPRCIP